jgi:tRNA-Thr(GGU) m(6)t(6)A37 methyltransferase TsaA
VISFELRPIGHVTSALTLRADAPRQGDEGAPEATIVIDAAFVAALHGVKVGADYFVLTWLHEADRDTLAVHPRDDTTRPLAGVFNTRSSDRPNPIGLHRVRVLAIDATSVRVSALEAIDGTPVVDLKPVIGTAYER